MARVKLGTIVVGIRGTVGGLLLSSNLSGPYARVWSKGSNPRKSLQTASRTAFAQSAASWSGVDGAVKLDWAAWAAAAGQTRYNSLGEPYQMSGFNALVSNTRNQTAVGRTPTTTAPTMAKPTAPAGCAVFLRSYPLLAELSWTGSVFGPMYDAVIEMSLGGGPGLSVARTGWIKVWTSQQPLVSPVTFSNGVRGRFGALAAGQRAFFRIYRQNLEGYRSSELALTVDVV